MDNPPRFATSNPMTRALLGGLALVSLNAQHAQSDVRMPAIFGDHMVLQQDVKLPIWGTAASGEQVTVTIGSDQGQATADASGKWMVRLNPLPVSDKPVEVQVQGNNKLVFKDVLVGDVWVCSSQSNMEFGIGNASNAKEVLPKLTYPAIRMFLLQHSFAFEPKVDVERVQNSGTWMVCTPQNAINIGGWYGFSAVGLFFARDIYEQRKQPLGLVGSYCGGSPIQAWTSEEAFRGNPPLARFADKLETDKATLAANYPSLKQKYDTETLPQWQMAHDQWLKAMDDWKKAASQPSAAPSPRPKEPTRPAPPGPTSKTPCTLFNGMINPLIPYAVKGVIWYQGESNAGKEEGHEYASLFSTMIADWRQRWGLGDFPFLFVQLSAWKGAICCNYVRDSQLKTLSLPNTGMVVTMDTGDLNDIHPKDKVNVGRRLALVARRVAYGEHIVYSGPIFTAWNVEANRIRVSFKHSGSGLTIGSAPTSRIDEQPQPIADHLNGFEVAGADKNFQPAQARIDGDTVLVWSDAVSQPKDVRYGWTAFPIPPLNLYNKDGLPASPFNSLEGAPVLHASLQ